MHFHDVLENNSLPSCALASSTKNTPPPSYPAGELFTDSLLRHQEKRFPHRGAYTLLVGVQEQMNNMCESFFFLRQEKKERKWYSEGLSEQKKEWNGGVNPADVWDERAPGKGKRRPGGTRLARAGTAAEVSDGRKGLRKTGQTSEGGGQTSEGGRQPDGGLLAFIPAGSKAITGSRVENWPEETHIWKRSLWTLGLKYCCASRETSQKAPVTIQARDDGDLGGGSRMMVRGQILLNVVGRADRMCWRTEHGIRHLSSGPPK